MKCRWVDLAVKEARKSEYKHRMGAVVFNKNQFISTGHNYACRSINSHLPIFRHWPTSLHAEVIAIINARTDLKGASLLVVRINNKDELKLALPCSNCMAYLQYVGIKKVYYSIDEPPHLALLKL